MDHQEKKLAADISETLHLKLLDSDSEAKKLKKAIKKTAKKHAEKVVKISVKKEGNPDKVSKKQNADRTVEPKKAKKQKVETGLKGIYKTERESLLVKEDQ